MTKRTSNKQVIAAIIITVESQSRISWSTHFTWVHFITMVPYHLIGRVVYWVSHFAHSRAYPYLYVCVCAYVCVGREKKHTCNVRRKMGVNDGGIECVVTCVHYRVAARNCRLVPLCYAMLLPPLSQMSVV